MKNIILSAAFITLALSSPAFAAGMDYSSAARDTTDTDNTSVNSNTTSAGSTNTIAHRHHHKKLNNSTSNGRHPNAGNVPTHSEDMNDNATSRQGEPSGETNGAVNGQSDDQNYGQPTNH